MTKRRPLEDAVEFAENPEPRCPCVLLLDTSQSMEGEKIEALNQGLRVFRQNLASDQVAKRRVEVAVVTFDDTARVRQSFVTVDDFWPPTLVASGRTHMGEGIQCAFDLLRERKERYDRHRVSYYRPWVFMITDGEPDGESPAIMTRAIERVRIAEREKQAAFFAVAVEGADTARLKDISVRQPLELDGMRFRELFFWLSASMQRVSASDATDAVVSLPPPTSWIKRFSDFFEENREVIDTTMKLVKGIIKA